MFVFIVAEKKNVQYHIIFKPGHVRTGTEEGEGRPPPPHPLFFFKEEFECICVFHHLVILR